MTANDRARIDKYKNKVETFTQLWKKAKLNPHSCWRWMREYPEYHAHLKRVLETNKWTRIKTSILENIEGEYHIKPLLEKAGVTYHTWKRLVMRSPSFRKEVMRLLQEERDAHEYRRMEATVPTEQEQIQNYKRIIFEKARQPNKVTPQQLDRERMNTWGDWYYLRWGSIR